MSVLDTTTFRRCTKCKCWKPETYQFFYIHKHGKIESWCRRCVICQTRARDAKNREERQAYVKAWHKANKERVDASKRKWWEANKDKHNATVRAYEKRNPHVSAASTRRYVARKHAAEGTHAAEDILDMYDSQEGLCAYCEAPLFGTYDVDHMLPLSRGGSNSWDNLAITCETCNSRKYTKTVEEFFNS